MKIWQIADLGQIDSQRLNSQAGEVGERAEVRQVAINGSPQIAQAVSFGKLMDQLIECQVGSVGRQVARLCRFMSRARSSGLAI